LIAFLTNSRALSASGRSDDRKSDLPLPRGFPQPSLSLSHYT